MSARPSPGITAFLPLPHLRVLLSPRAPPKHPPLTHPRTPSTRRSPPSLSFSHFLPPSLSLTIPISQSRSFLPLAAAAQFPFPPSFLAAAFLHDFLCSFQSCR